MKKSLYFAAVFVALAGGPARAQDQVTNRFTFSARLGLNISAKFKDLTLTLAPAAGRTTPDGAAYNYDDGYVLTDVSGNFGGQTWNWGYDDSASQISGNTILLSRSTPATADFPSRSSSSDPNYGGELTYNRLLGVINEAAYGFEVAGSYLDIALRDNRTFSSQATRLVDAYPFTPGTTPPAATPALPYQGTFNGPGFVIGATKTNSTTTVSPGPTATDRRRFDADLWGFHLGPYLEVPLGDNFSLALSGGLAVGLLESEASWAAQIAGGPSLSGSGRHESVLWGGYVGANLLWRWSEHWSAVGGVQYQNLGTYRHSYGGREVELDLRKSLFVSLGLGYDF
jgi:hypothetical protein